MISLRFHVEPIDSGELSRPERITILRGQITLLRHRCEAGLPVTVDALAGGEKLARSVESEELAG